jgi:hypothetical protein
MNENDIGAGLAKLDKLRTEDDDRRLAREILQRQQRRVWLLSGLTVAFWAMSATGVFFVVYSTVFHLYPKQQQLLRAQVTAGLPPEQLIEIQASHFRAVELCTLVVAGSFIAASLAAICTLLLIFVSRQATLAQINLSLTKIFDLLKQPTSGDTDERLRDPTTP